MDNDLDDRAIRIQGILALIMIAMMSQFVDPFDFPKMIYEVPKLFYHRV